MVGERDGLPALQMGISGHDRFGVRLRFFQKRFDQFAAQRQNLADFVVEIQLHVQRHLIVAASGGVQPFARVANAVGQFRFDKHMDVLGVGVESQIAAFDIL